MVALGGASRMVFGRDTVASFLRDSNEVTVLLGQGNVSVFHDADGMPVRMKIGDVSIVPVSGFKTLGEVAMLNGAVVVTAKDGMLRVEGNGQVVNVAKGKTITVVPQANAPQGGGCRGAGRCCGGSNVWGITATGAGVAAAILAGVAMSRAGDAKNNAAAADLSSRQRQRLRPQRQPLRASAAISARQCGNSLRTAVGCALNILRTLKDEPSPYRRLRGFAARTCSG